jgi:acyl-CoA reductase-like NAD-dependent aldehyde dehydrogenase
VREEIFGPVVCMQPFEEDKLDTIATLANDTEYSQSTSIWTGSALDPQLGVEDQGRHGLGEHPQLG